MPDHFPAKPDPEVLHELVAARLLQRASELDAARAAESVVVGDLRAAAIEAGISGRAFDAAFAELQEAGQARVRDMPGQPQRRRRPWALVTACAALIAAGALAVSRGVAVGEASVPGVPMVDEAYLLRCLSAIEAADLVRPHLSRASTIWVQKGSRVLNVRVTPAELPQIKAVLEKYEGAGSSACASEPPGTAPR